VRALVHLDYQTFRRHRDELLKSRAPLRLDCMNPSQALAAWVPRRSEPAQANRNATEEALAAWSTATGIDLKDVRIGWGMRDLLGRILALLAHDADEFWLPEDVYPVYWELAGTHRPCRGFRTIPEVDWGFLDGASERAVLLCPVPLSPLGRMPKDGEIQSLRRWLHASPARFFIADSAYSYDFSAVRSPLGPLLIVARAAVLWSCSKPWLLPGALGIAEAPAELAPRLENTVDLSEEHVADAAFAITTRPDLPLRQQQAFTREWELLSPKIRAAAPDWNPPETGYFSVVAVPFQELLDEHDTLAVPASVFGSKRSDCSVITCLHDLILHQGGR